MENEINEKQLDKKPTSWKKKLVIGLITALIVAVSFTLGFFTKVWTTSEKERIINWVINTIDEHYYCEEDGVIKDFTAEDYADAIIETLLDRYSNYYTAEEYTDAMNTSSGNYFGTGVKFLKDSDSNALYGVSLNSPAYKAGLKAGDVIVEGKGVNGENKTLSTKTQVLEFIENQPQNSQFSLYYTRNGGEKQQVKVARQVFISAYVEYFDNEFKGEFLSEGATSPKLVSTPSNEKNYLGSGVGFMRLVEFHGDAYSQMSDALNFMKERGKTKLILDLRNNGGGNMEVLEDICSLFISKSNSVVAVAKYKNGDYKNFKMGASHYASFLQQVSIVANENSASASECLIGALNHYGETIYSNANLVIEKNALGVAKTYGKGVMQTTYRKLGGGEGIKITTAIIYQPNGETTINGVGFYASNENSVEINQGVVRANAILG